MMKDSVATLPRSVQDELLAEIGHELRNPASSVLAFADALQDGVFGPVNDAQKEALVAIRTCAQKQVQLINDLLDARKLQISSPSYVAEVCRAQDLVEFAVEQQVVLIGARKASVSTEVLPPSLVIRADPKRLPQMVSLLLQLGLLGADMDVRVKLTIRESASGVDLLVEVGTHGSHLKKLATEESLGPNSAVETRLGTLGPIEICLLKELLRLHGAQLHSGENADGAFWLGVAIPQASD